MSKESSHSHSGAAHGSVPEYLRGLLISVILTIIPFYMVIDGSWGATATTVVILINAIAQVLVQMVYFLHMNGSSGQSWLTVSAVYTVAVIVFVIIGSLWIFEHLNHNLLMGH